MAPRIAPRRCEREQLAVGGAEEDCVDAGEDPEVVEKDHYDASRAKHMYASPAMSVSACWGLGLAGRGRVASSRRAAQQSLHRVTPRGVIAARECGRMLCHVNGLPAGDTVLYSGADHAHPTIHGFLCTAGERSGSLMNGSEAVCMYHNGHVQGCQAPGRAVSTLPVPCV